jgi:amino acid transporter
VQGLRRSLRFWGALALGLAIMAPTLALSLNGSAPAADVGRAVPLVFLLGGIGMAFVAFGFAVLTRRFNHSGSAYALVGATLGSRPGFFSGFALAGYYLFSTICCVAAAGLFIQSFLDSIGLHNVPWLLLGVLSAIVAGWLSMRDTRSASRVLLVMEGLGIVLVAALTITIFARIGAGSAPDHQTVSWTVFQLPAHTPFSTLGAAVVFACLSWAGFEGIATLGEETSNARRNIPLALLGSILLTLPLFVFVMMAESNGFGASAAGAAKFAASSTPLGDLARSFVGEWAARLLLLAAAASAFASLLGSCTAASRMLFAFSRDGLGPSWLSRLSKTGTPSYAAIASLVLAIVINVAMAINGTSSTNVYFYYATIGVLCLLVAYAMVGIAAASQLLRTKRIVLLGAIPALIGSVFAGYIFYIQSTGQSSPYNTFPYYAGAWCLAGLLIVLLSPGLASRIGEKLSRAELGDAAEATAEVSPSHEHTTEGSIS